MTQAERHAQATDQARRLNQTDQARIDELQKPVGSVSVLASEESDRATGKTNTILGTLNHVGRHVPVSIGVDDDFDEPLPARTCAIDGEECESCQ